MRVWFLSPIATLLLVLACAPAWAETMTITYCPPESETDTRHEYDNALLKLALEKTKATWGDYELVASDSMNTARLIKMLKRGTLKNPMFKLSAETELCNSLGYVPFPVDLGIVGYRVFFTAAGKLGKLEAVSSLADLKRFSVGQGDGWADVDILSQAGFAVHTSPSYEALFQMVVAGNRFDLFPRGVNEIKGEFEAHRDIANLAVERKLVLYYPLPRFFFTNQHGSEQALKRVSEGLAAAYDDGSLQELWEKHYKESVDYVDLNSRKVFTIDNPLLKGVDNSYDKYMYKIK